MKKITKYIVGGLAALALVGCQDKMRELNTSDEILADADPRYIFNGVMQNFNYQSPDPLLYSTGVMMQYFVSDEGAVDATYCYNEDYSSPGSSSALAGQFYGVGKQMYMMRKYIDEAKHSADFKTTHQDLYAIAGIVEVFTAFRTFENYGAAVYTEAFEAVIGVIKPTYDIFTPDIYKELDARIKGYIAVLDAPMNVGTVDLGFYDPIYGYVSAPDGAPKAAPTRLGDYAKQREHWRRFGNSARLDMAWRMSQVPELISYFDNVLAETIASGLFRDAADGCFTYNQGPDSSIEYYRPQTANKISFDYSVTDNFVNYLKELNDPRLPILARVNDLFPDNEELQWIQKYFPDSLKYAKIDGVLVPWGNLTGIGNPDAQYQDPMMAYQGQTAVPFLYETEGPGQLWGTRTWQFRFYREGYKVGDKAHNDALGPWTVTNPNDASDVFTIKNPDTSFVFDMASRPQGRYVVSCGGSETDDEDVNNHLSNGGDGSADNRDYLYFTNPVYTYPEQCFMMAYLALEGKTTGASADVWYERGITAAMTELQNDAIRCEVQVTIKDPTRKVAGVNDVNPYRIDATMIANYITANKLSSFADMKEAVVGQIWVYSYRYSYRTWNWWRMTGYPKTIEANTIAQRNAIGKRPYFAKPTSRETGYNLEFPRRGNFEQRRPNDVNNDNFNIAAEKLLELPNYGSTIQETTGRIFWDRQGL